MQVSPFLTDIAKSYNSAVQYVAFCDLDGRCLGEVQARRSFESYRIHIDRDRMICPHQVLFMFFHEIGHIVCDHMGYRYYRLPGVYLERGADEWAFMEMGMLDKQWQVKEENKACYDCMNQRSKRCLKGLDL